MHMHVRSAGAKTGRLGAQQSHCIQVWMTECSKYICIGAFFFDLYRIIMSLPQPHFHSLPHTVLLHAHSWLVSQTPPATTHFPTSYERYTLFSHRRRKANASPPFALIIQSVCSECERREQRQRERTSEKL